MAIQWWAALKRSLSCKSQASCDVIKRDDDGSRGGSARGLNLKRSFRLPPSSSLPMPRSGCSRSISNLRDVVHGSARRQGVRCDSPMSVESSHVLNSVTAASGRRDLRAGAGSAPGLAAWDIGPVPHALTHSPLLMRCSTARPSQRKSPLYREVDPGLGDVGSPLPDWVSRGNVVVRCDRCGGRFPNDNALESHHLVYHAVTEVVDDDAAGKVVELIYQVGWPNPEAALDGIERVVKVHNIDRTVDRYKEYMEEVKGRAAKLPNKHPRCIADGNELLQFHATTVACSLGAGGSHSLCTSSTCNACRIIRRGFSVVRESRNGRGVGVLTTSTSKHALECLQETGAGDGVKRALFVCRVIAGRIHRPLEKLGQDAAVQPGFDSVAGQVGADSSIEELYLLNPSALLPCFVVICKA